MTETWTIVCLFRHNSDQESDNRTYLFRDEEIWPAFRQQLDERSMRAEALLRIATGWGERWSAHARQIGCGRKDIQRAEALTPVVVARMEQQVNADIFEPPIALSHIYHFSAYVSYEMNFGDGDDLEGQELE